MWGRRLGRHVRNSLGRADPGRIWALLIPRITYFVLASLLFCRFTSGLGRRLCSTWNRPDKLYSESKPEAR